VTQLAYVAGATGYTGREVVAALTRSGVETVAHVRPGSADLTRWRERFNALGATVDETPWEVNAMRATLAARRPTLVFALLGTTRARAAREGLTDAYERIDYGLSAMLLDAARHAGSLPKFVYLSALGVSDATTNPYLAARARLERELVASGLTAVIVRPAFITGPDREERRVLEQVLGAATDVVLAIAGGLGATKLRDRWSSLTGAELAEGMVHIALSTRESRLVVDPSDIRRALREN